MTKEESAKILAVYYTYEINTFRRCEVLRQDLAGIYSKYDISMGESKDEEFSRLFDGYCKQLEKNGRNNPPRWAKLIMAEKYAINI